jgi:histidyl-tRNA synthetase
MSNNIRLVRGTKDLYAKDYLAHQYIINQAQSIANAYAYEALQTPIFEYSSIFSRSMGETSDVVGKEMYSFVDRSGDSLTLRPEFTAAIVRSFISNNFGAKLPVKFFSHGPVFRHERPQSFRFRQFHQINFEYLGIDNYLADVEIISMAALLLDNLQILDKTTLELNSLGDNETRINYQKALVEYFHDFKDSLSPDSKIRLEKNPMRILDSKDEEDQKIVANCPTYSNYYNSYSFDFFANLQNSLTQLGISYHLNPHLVRGLDYYNHTTFEFVTKDLGACATVLAGGRYNGLVKLLGGADTPAIGFASGIERLGGLINPPPTTQKRAIVVIAIGKEMLEKCAYIAHALRSNNMIVAINYKHDIVKQMQHANEINAKFAVIIGADEDRLGKVKVKDLDLRTEELVAQDNLINFLKVKHERPL